MKHKSLVIRSVGMICLTFTLVVLAACSSQKPALASVAAAEYQLKVASQSEAPRYAPRELAVAQEKLRLAELAINEKNFVLARRLGEQASVDANYAMARSQAELAVVDTLQRQPAKRARR